MLEDIWRKVLLQKSKSAIFDGCNPLKYRDTILDKSVKTRFLQQNSNGWHAMLARTCQQDVARDATGQCAVSCNWLSLTS
jgi:hypothetical protein